MSADEVNNDFDIGAIFGSERLVLNVSRSIQQHDLIDTIHPLTMTKAPFIATQLNSTQLDVELS